MKIGLLVPSIGGFGQKGFYNTQEIGLAKALDKYFEEVLIYKLVPHTEEKTEETVQGCRNAHLYTIPSRKIGTNGMADVNILDKTLDVLICFSDTQLCVPTVYKWAKKNSVRFYPYIGVFESHSVNKLNRMIMDVLSTGILKIYKKCHCMVKTPTVKQNLHKLGVSNISVTPVGLDLTLLHQDAENVDVEKLKAKYGFKAEDKIILFIGRLIEEKQPIRMLDIFSEINRKNQNYKLLMVGKGPLQEKVNERISALGIEDYVNQIKQIPNCDIWELYRMSDCFVNLNSQEIFGMAILEAMYYGCKVVAWKAPGPELIIEDGISGYLVDSNSAVVDKAMEMHYDPESGRQRVLENFTWDNMAQKIHCLVNDEVKCVNEYNIAVVGHFMYRNAENEVNGQTIKTKNYEQVLVERYGRERVRTLDTDNFKKRLVPNYMRLFSIAKNCNVIFILPTENGLILMLPVLYVLKKIFSFKILYPVIGGWLPEFLEKNKLIRYFISCADRIYPETENMANDLRKLGTQNVETAFNFSLKDKAAKEQKEHKIGELFKFCTFSRVTEKKGIRQAVEAVDDLNKVKKIAELDIYGPIDPAYQDEFAALIEENQDHAGYKGVLSGENIIPVLGEYDLMLFPTYYPGEGMPGAVIEALAAGTPVIASDWHYNKEVVTDGYSGIIYSLEEPHGLLDSIKRLIEDRTVLQDMRKNCVEESRRYSAEAVMKPIFQYIEETK